MSKQIDNKTYDLICIGGGIMSTTFSLMLKLLHPKSKILILEKLSEVGQESSKTMNNAGTGHSGNCELNYTPEKEDGSVDISKALQVCREFELTKQFWSYLIKENLLADPKSFIHQSSHCSWVHDKKQVEFLKKRFEAMKSHVEFEHMEFSEDFETMREWFPLIIEDRDQNESLAATKVPHGTEIDFEKVTKSITDILTDKYDVNLLTNHEVNDLSRIENGWNVEAKSKDDVLNFKTKKVFIGAGGGSLPLLQKAEIEDHHNYGGFPVSGHWLVCDNQDLVKKHNAQVYSKASKDNPPMSAPHLDKRHVGDEKKLLFGPFAGFSGKFLKKGSPLDLIDSINFENIPTYLGAFWKNLDLTEYLVEQMATGKEGRMEELKKFIKNAKPEDWEIQTAGQRVQILKKTEEGGASLEFGTEVVSNKDGTITALLGASPGASTAVKIGLTVLEKEYSELMNSEKSKQKLDKIVPFWNKSVEGNEDDYRKVRENCQKTLKLESIN